MNYATGLYYNRMPFWLEARQLARTINIVFILAFAFVSMVKMSDHVSRLLLLFLWFYTFSLSIVIRYVVKRVLCMSPFFVAKTVIIGKYDEAQEYIDTLNSESYMGFGVVGVVSTDESDIDNAKYPLLGYIEDVDSVIDEHNVDVAIFLPSFEAVENSHIIASRLQIKLSNIYFISPKQRVAFSNVRTMQTFKSQVSILQVDNNISSFVNRLLKRSFDLLLCLLALPTILLFTVVIVVAIRATSKGSAFYKQERIGRGGKKIYVYKFRSMYKDADDVLNKALLENLEMRMEWERTFKLKNDPRVTKVGKFLRKTSLDELPQLFNVIKGDMSLVGPRPVVQKEIDEYYKEYAEYYKMVRPGITGLWQISGRSNTTYDYRILKDTWYVLNWSVWLDIVILMETPKVVIMGEGAY